MTLEITLAQARRLMTVYHFTPTDLPGAIARLGTIQYDPLNPAGRNADLVFQARVPGYRVDDWQQAAYTDRLLYDAWDKQACLVPISDWPMRALVNSRYNPYHYPALPSDETPTMHAILAALDTYGPLSSLELEQRVNGPAGSTPLGTTGIARVLRALWAAGQIVTHHRQAGRHYYDRAVRVIPAAYYDAPPLLEEATYYQWIMARRHQSVGLLRPNAEAVVWSVCGDSAARKTALATALAEGTLTAVKVAGTLYHAPTRMLDLLDAPLPPPRLIFVAPLDSLLWDRKAVSHLFGFDYIWEVYKPEAQRRWGYYVLPVFYGDRFVARIDSRLIGGVWTVHRWWWEADIMPDADLLAALHSGVTTFLAYLGATGVRLPEDVDPAVRMALADLAA